MDTNTKKFSPDWDNKLDKKDGTLIINEGHRLGQSEPVKDCYWAVYSHNGRKYISLNDNNSDVWDATECSDVMTYIDN